MGEAASRSGVAWLFPYPAVNRSAETGARLHQTATPKPECARLAVNGMGDTKATLMVRATAERSF
jgi:hypothetical protein